MSNDLARTGPVGVAMSNPADALRACELLLSSGVLPADIRTAEAAFAILQTGAEMGLAPMQALRSIHVVKGRPILSADLMVAMCLRSGVCRFFRCVADDGQRAEYETLREGMPEPSRMAYTLAEAEQAGLTRNPTWRAHTRAMLRARAKSALARDVYPDLVAGIYTPDEGREIAGDYHAPQPSRPVDVLPESAPVDTTAILRVLRAHGMADRAMAEAWLSTHRPPTPCRWPETQEDADALAAWLATPAAAMSARAWHVYEGTPRAMTALGFLLSAEGHDPSALVADVRRRGIGAPQDPSDGPTASRWWAWWSTKGREVYGLARDGAE